MKTAPTAIRPGTGKSQLPQGLPYDLILLIKKFLLSIKTYEGQVEQLRQRLARHKLFEPHAAFQRIDRDSDGKITSVDLLRFLRENGSQEVNEQDCFALVRYFGATGFGALNYKDFLQIMMPCDNSNLRAEIAQRPNSHVEEVASLDGGVEQGLTALLLKEIEFNRCLEQQRQSLECMKQFDREKAYHELDDWNYGFVDKTNLKSFLKKHGYLPSNTEVCQIIRRIDLDGDARISKEEFIQALTPEEPYSKLIKRQKEKERPRAAFAIKTKKQGGHYLNYQDLILNMKDGGRDIVRTRARDLFISNSGPKGKSIHGFGDIGSTSLKVKPDLHRMGQGFFARETFTPTHKPARKQPGIQLLVKKYNDNYKDDYLRKLRRGDLKENFKQDRVWRPGGKSIQSVDQGDADVALLHASKSVSKSINQSVCHPGTKKKKRTKSAKAGKRKQPKQPKKKRRSSNYIMSSEVGPPQFLPEETFSAAQPRRAGDHFSHEGKAHGKFMSADYDGYGQASPEQLEYQSLEKQRNNFELFDNARDVTTFRIRRPEESESKPSTAAKGRGGLHVPKFESQRPNQDLPQEFTYGRPQEGSLRPESQGRCERQASQGSHRSLQPRPIDQMGSQAKLRSPPQPSQQQYNPRFPPSQRSFRQEAIPSNRQSLEHIVGQLEEHEKRVFVEYLIELINLGRTLESAKMDLARMGDFNLMDAFSVFDEAGLGYCTSDQFFDKLHKLGLDPVRHGGMKQVHMFFRRYNKSGDGQLKYSEFMHAFSPMCESYAEMLKERRAKNMYSRPKQPIAMFRSETYTNFIIVIETLLKTEIETERVKQQLRSRSQFLAGAAFLTMAQWQLKKIQYEPRFAQMTAEIDHVNWRDLEELMSQHGHSQNIEKLDLQLLIDRFDRDGDGLISKKEFQDLINPMADF